MYICINFMNKYILNCTRIYFFLLVVNTVNNICTFCFFLNAQVFKEKKNDSLFFDFLKI